MPPSWWIRFDASTSRDTVDSKVESWGGKSLTWLAADDDTEQYLVASNVDLTQARQKELGAKGSATKIAKGKLKK